MGTALKIFTQATLTTIIVTSLFLNICLMCYVLRRSPIHTKDKLTVSLAISDLLRSFFGYIMEMSLRVNGRCNLVGFTISFLSYTAINHLVLIMFDRWWVITRFASGRRFRASNLTVYLLIAFCWFHAAVFAAMPFVGLGAYGLDQDGLRCSVSWRDRGFSHRLYHWLLFVFFFFVPLLLMTSFFAALRRAIRRSRIVASATFQETTATVITEQRMKAERRNLLMFTTMSLVFSIAWLPYALISFHYAFINATTAINNSLQVLAVIPAKASTLYSPLVISLYDQGFRRFVKGVVTFNKAELKSGVAVIGTGKRNSCRESGNRNNCNT